jgi:hypothetical protein
MFHRRARPTPQFGKTLIAIFIEEFALQLAHRFDFFLGAA